VARRVSMRWVHSVSALVFLVLGLLTLLNPGQRL
jgi:putative Ca2+/H+ antiporter (TMEM165/GDT1 family)